MTLGVFGVELPGFEPRMTEPKSAVLPLHHSSIQLRKAMQMYDNFLNLQTFSEKISYFCAITLKKSQNE